MNWVFYEKDSTGNYVPACMYNIGTSRKSRRTWVTRYSEFIGEKERWSDESVDKRMYSSRRLKDMTEHDEVMCEIMSCIDTGYFDLSNGMKRQKLDEYIQMQKIGWK